MLYRDVKIVFDQSYIRDTVLYSKLIVMIIIIKNTRNFLLVLESKGITSYIAQYPGPRTVQSAFTLYFPGRPVQSNTISTSLGSIQP